ncbi:MAG: radical SAM protein [Candidatus Omnitrophota bacterium]|jgi:wyosine [tRNA(Phe)-imidazoG37] synthetase (radical SAM superfamily)
MKNIPGLLIADKNGRISICEDLAASSMKNGCFYKIEAGDLIKLPQGSRLFMLPGRAAIGYDPVSGFLGVKNSFAVAAFLRPGYAVTFSPSYREMPGIRPLPLFSYAACALYKGELYATGMLVDKDRRHDQRFIDIDTVATNIRKLKKIFPSNRLIPHLEQCALVYGCANAQNFFLSRYEAPLPTSPACNARCAGCISFQAASKLCASQPRIKFIPSPDELAQVALFHIFNAKNPIVSFGQGCEGEPLLAGNIIESAINLIRNVTAKGTININTNGSKPMTLARLFDCGLDSARISLNSARPAYYNRYYRPSGYKFNDVMNSIKNGKRKGKFISINYLTMPGFTDSKNELEALKELIATYKIDMIQWRNLNYDPLLYFKKLKVKAYSKGLVGIDNSIEILKKKFPRLRIGYFNPAVASRRQRHPWK